MAMPMICRSFKRPMSCVGVCFVITALLACNTATQTVNAAQHYRCEHGIEFSARFTAEAVVLDSNRGYELLFRDAQPLPDPPKLHEYRNPRMSVEFFQSSIRPHEAVLRYLLLPLAVRCVKD